PAAVPPASPAAPALDAAPAGPPAAPAPGPEPTVVLGPAPATPISPPCPTPLAPSPDAPPPDARLVGLGPEPGTRSHASSTTTSTVATPALILSAVGARRAQKRNSWHGLIASSSMHLGPQRPPPPSPCPSCRSA